MKRKGLSLFLVVSALSSGCVFAPLMTKGSDPSPGAAVPTVSGYPAPGYPAQGMPMDPATALQRAADIQTAMAMNSAERVALSYYYEHETYEGFTPEVAAEYDPSIRWNASPTAVEGEVSIRGLTTLTVVLASRDSSGRTWCMGDDRGQDLTYHGMADPATAAECPNEGWPGF